MQSPHALAILAVSVFIFALSLGAAVLGRHQDSLFAEPGRPDASTPFRPGR